MSDRPPTASRPYRLTPAGLAALRASARRNRPWLASTGPRTAAGKAAASANALWHGERSAGMHTTDTVDYAIVLQGEIWAVMDQDEALLTAGDILIQRGTAHGWENRSDRMARVAFVLVDATRGGVSR